jgi:hypothetical protein
MSIDFGGIKSEQIIENEFRIMVLENIVEQLLNKNEQALTNFDISVIKAQVIAILQKKYPNSGIDLV